MSEVRSSDLETGLSSSDDRVILEATSLSTPNKALDNFVFPHGKGRTMD